MNDASDSAPSTHLPRMIQIGPLRLDLFHRDAIVNGNWVRFHPREFEVLWKLAEAPGVTLSKRFFLTEVWRLDHAPETNSLEVHISRIRAKLQPFRLSWLIETSPEGGYRLAVSMPSSGHKPTSSSPEPLDTHVRIGNDGAQTTDLGEPHGLSEERTRIN